MLEIEDQANAQPSDFEMIEHLADFMIGHGFNGFYVHDNGIGNDQVGNIFANLFIFIENIVTRLLPI